MGTRFNKLKNNIVLIFSAPLLFFSLLIQGNVWFASLFGQYVNVATILVLVAFVSSEIYQKWKEGVESKEMYASTQKHHEESKESFENARITMETVQKIEKEIEESNIKTKENYKKNSLLIDLINEQLIPIQVVDETISDKKFVTIFCTSEGFYSNLPSHIKQMNDDDSEYYDSEGYRQFRPDYVKIFEKLRFVQLSGGKPYFIIAEENIYPEKLRDITKLSEYLMQKARLLLNEKWDLIMKDAEINSPTFYKRRQNKDNPLNFNMLLIKSNRRDMRHRFKVANDFNPEFTTELASLSNIEKIKSKMKENEKIEIKKFVLKSSIKILILKINKSDQKKILELESMFRKPEAEGGLGIKYFYDYHTKDEENIARILRSKFSEESKVIEYKNMIMENSKKYKNDLVKLGIDLSE